MIRKSRAKKFGKLYTKICGFPIVKDFRKKYGKINCQIQREKADLIAKNKKDQAKIVIFLIMGVSVYFRKVNVDFCYDYAISIKTKVFRNSQL